MEALADEFRGEFGDDSGFEGCDFRPHFDGSLINVFRLVVPVVSRDTQMSLIWGYVREMATWILANRNQLHSGDRFQLIVGWPENVRPNSRQIVKLGGDFDELTQIATAETYLAYEALPRPPVFRKGWDSTIYT